MTRAPTRPALRYHGGKWRLAPWIIDHFPEHRCYVEPFAGAASVLLQKPPSLVEVYNDLDDRVVNFFRVLRDPEKANALRVQLDLTPNSRSEHRASRLPHPDPIEDARRMVVRSFQSVGAQSPGKPTGWRCRFRQRFNFQMSWNGWPEQMPAFVERLKEVLIESAPWREIVELYDDPQTLFYCDPPYVTSTRTRGMTDTYAHEMTDADHEELCEVLLAAKGMVILSGYKNDIYCEKLAGWMTESCKSLAQAHAQRVETIWINPRAAKLQRGLFNE